MFSSPVRGLVGAYLAARVGVLLVIVIAHRTHAELDWLRLFAAWDGGYYLQIAASGYETHIPSGPGDGNPGIAFFPGFPVLLRGVSTLTGLPVVTVGVLLNVAIGAMIVVVLHRLGSRFLPTSVATRATLLFIALPGGFVFSVLYADALVILLCCSCLLLLDQSRWLAAGVVGAAATFTRANSVGLIAAAIVAAAIAFRQGRRELAPLLPVVMIPLGMLSYLAYVWRHTGDAFGWFHVQRQVWFQELDFGRGFLGPLRHPELWHSWAYWTAVSGVPFLVLALWGLVRGARLPAIPAAFTALTLMQMLVYSSVGLRPRFMLMLFPITWLIASGCGRRTLAIVSVISAVALLGLTYAYVTLTAVP